MTATQELRARIDEAVAQLDDIPPQKLARLLVAKACDISLGAGNAMQAAWITEGATNLLAGRWSAETIENFINREH